MCLLVLLIIFFASFTSASAQIKINDFCANCETEWVDLKNFSSDPISLDQWKLLNRNGDKLLLSGMISTEILRFTKTKGWLNNEEGKIILINGIGETIDQLFYPIPTSTPSATPTLVPTPTSTPSATPTIESTPTPSTIIDNLFINEIMPNPDTGSEWLEIYNDNDFEVNLENYKIKDDTTHYRTIGANIISAHSYFIFMFNNYLNNDLDSITLFDNYNRQIGESFSYTFTKKGLSYSKQEDGFLCFTQSSMNQDNNSCYSEPTNTPPPTGGPTHTPTPTKVPMATHTPRPTKVPKITTPKPTKKPTATRHPSIKKSKTSSKKQIPPIIIASEIPTTSEVPTLNQENDSSTSNIIPVTFISLGALFLLSPLIIL